MSVNEKERATPSENLRVLIDELRLTASEVALTLGTSYAAIVRWYRKDSQPSPATAAEIENLVVATRQGRIGPRVRARSDLAFASKGARKEVGNLPLFRKKEKIELLDLPTESVATRLRHGDFWGGTSQTLGSILEIHQQAAKTLPEPLEASISAGKNTYTYDAHTYHTKVPPQGIAKLIRSYLPEGGLVLDPFAGSGMTGVAALTLGYDVVLNELSPAACFIANRFTTQIDSVSYQAGVRTILDELSALRRRLYTTVCRECSKRTEIQYTVWSYDVLCHFCQSKFSLWDFCRKYGRTVREHKILAQFPCPSCKKTIKKSKLERLDAKPVFLGYKCCSKKQVEHPLDENDLALLESIQHDSCAAEGYYPLVDLPPGVNLSQPRRHGFTSIASLYSVRNLAALSHLWREIHRIEEANMAGFLAFVFTSLYQRVTRLSEYRFWGGSGNTANLNVPYIFNEANVFVSFERKARTIQDHLETTVRHYTGNCLVRTGSATSLEFLPDNSIDLIFTDPPFGANINYSEMNIIWEAWLGEFTDPTDEAIVNRIQKKDTQIYGNIMSRSLRECNRVLRNNHWLLLVFMNSSRLIWEQLRRAIQESGFVIEQINVFDKQHGTFKQFVSDNTAGSDLILHCRKGKQLPDDDAAPSIARFDQESVKLFLQNRPAPVPRLPFLHVSRVTEIDYRSLYSEWLTKRLTSGSAALLDFGTFRNIAQSVLESSTNLND